MNQVLTSDTPTAMGWGNRGSLDIINYILLACANGSMITHIMYRCNLNSKQTQSYVALLLKHRLLEKTSTLNPSKNLYQATVLAGKYTGAYSELSEIFDLPFETKEAASKGTKVDEP